MEKQEKELCRCSSISPVGNRQVSFAMKSLLFPSSLRDQLFRVTSVAAATVANNLLAFAVFVFAARGLDRSLWYLTACFRRSGCLCYIDVSG